MIVNLTIQNFAIIERCNIDFSNGMSALTGETGAGKSIIIDAIGQLIGQRSNVGFVKTGCEKAVIEAVINIEDNPTIDKLLEEYNINCDDSFLYVSKEILNNGKSISKLNYKQVPTTVIKTIMTNIIDVHSQHDTTGLINEKNYLKILDEFADDKLIELKNKYLDNYNKYISIKKEIDTIEKQENDFEQLDFYQSQLDEINQIDFDNFSIDELENEKEKIQSYDRIKNHISPFNNIVNNEKGALSQLYEGLTQLEKINDIESFSDIYDDIYELYEQLEDKCNEVINIYKNLDFDPFQLKEIQDQLSIFNRLKRKYGASEVLIIDKKNELENKIDVLNNRDQILFDLNSKLKEQEVECLEIANKMHEIRFKIANELSKRITSELKSLYMENAEFEIVLSKSNINPNGCSEVNFMISTNIGHEKQKMSAIASGGELSRIMLALKTILLLNSDISTIIFDEIDTGVSGKVAAAIGQKMNKIASKKQVLCITHLAQVAGYADNHYCISKNVDNNDTKTTINLLDNNQSIVELAKMLSGENITEDALNQAKTLKIMTVSS